MQLKKYLVMKGPTEELEIWPRTQYEQYIQGCVDFGAGSAYGIITHFDEQDRLLTDPPASAEDEAARLYPYDYENYDAEDHADVKIVREAQRSAHITCAGMYADTIDKLKAENSKMRQALKSVLKRCGESDGDYGQAVFDISEMCYENLRIYKD